VRARLAAATLDYGLRDRVALVTGAASGIGLATATLLAEMGLRVVASDVDAARGAAAATKLERAGHASRSSGPTSRPSMMSRRSSSM
jgi:NAD(P)-dependent dehydrogenase (short-subunit alcohol dehydrogenase family)